MTTPKVTVSADAQRAVLPDRFSLSAAVSGRATDPPTARAALVDGYTELEQAVAGRPESVEIRHGPLQIWPADIGELDFGPQTLTVRTVITASWSLVLPE